MIVPLGERYQQVFHLFEKKDGKLEQKKLLPAMFVPMTGKSEELREIRPDGEHPIIINGGFEERSEIDGFVKGWHRQRRTQLRDDAPNSGKRYMRIENEISGRSADIRQAWAIDGTKIAELSLSVAYRAKGMRPDPRVQESPSVKLYCYNAERKPLRPIVVTHWPDEQLDWKLSHHTIVIPSAAREAILQIGLADGTGTLDLDDLAVSVKKRR